MIMWQYIVIWTVSVMVNVPCEFIVPTDPFGYGIGEFISPCYKEMEFTRTRKHKNFFDKDSAVIFVNGLKNYDQSISNSYGIYLNNVTFDSVYVINDVKPLNKNNTYIVPVPESYDSIFRTSKKDGKYYIRSGNFAFYISDSTNKDSIWIGDIIIESP